MTHVDFDFSEINPYTPITGEVLYSDQHGNFRFPTPVENAVNDVFRSEAVARLVTSEETEDGTIVDRLLEGGKQVLVERTRGVTDEPNVFKHLGAWVSWRLLAEHTTANDGIVSDPQGTVMRHILQDGRDRVYPIAAEVKAQLKRQLGAIARIDQ